MVDAPLGSSSGWITLYFGTLMPLRVGAFIALGCVCLNLKMERVWQRDDANHAEAMSDIADHIISFCNSVRLHASLGNLPPNAFEQKSAINQLIDVSQIT